MLNKELLMGSVEAKGYHSKLTIGILNDYIYGYSRKLLPFCGELEPIPYWNNDLNSRFVIDNLYYDIDETRGIFNVFAYTTPLSVRVSFSGYSNTLMSNEYEYSDIFDLSYNDGAVRYLTFDPPPDGYI